jgi:hypothetical protein
VAPQFPDLQQEELDLGVRHYGVRPMMGPAVEASRPWDRLCHRHATGMILGLSIELWWRRGVILELDLLHQLSL